MDYNIDEVIDIIKKQLPNEIETIPHIQQRYIERNIDINYVISCLIDKTPLSIAKQDTIVLKLFIHMKHKSHKTFMLLLK